MGVDCIFVAHNTQKLTVADFERDLREGLFPGGYGALKMTPKVCETDQGIDGEIEEPDATYCWVRFINDLFIISDSSRCNSHQAEYAKQVLAYLERRCGGKVGVWPDDAFDMGTDPDLDSTTFVERYGDWRIHPRLFQ